MSTSDAVKLLLAFLGLYPIVSAAVWLAGGLLYRLFDERRPVAEPGGGWPGVSVLIPAFNEESVVGECVTAAREIDYPALEVLVLDDGSTDSTVAAATAAAGGDPRVRVIADPVNTGKADRLNTGLRLAGHDLVVVTDADTHIDPGALKLLVTRMHSSPLLVAVAGFPKVTNRRNLLCAMQVIEASAIIGLIRRTQAVGGRVAVVAGVLGLFRRDAVLAVGGYRSEMATEDIDLTYRLLLAGGHTSFEPGALVGMQVPAATRPLWAQRRRWARGQGEVLHQHLRELMRWRHRHLWPLALEGAGSLAWVVLMAAWYVVMLLVFVVGGVEPPHPSTTDLLFTWGIAIAVVATVQVTVALSIDLPYDRRAPLALLIAPVYPLVYWIIAAVAAIRAEVPALLRGPGRRRVVWDIPREQVATRPPSEG